MLVKSLLSSAAAALCIAQAALAAPLDKRGFNGVIRGVNLGGLFVLEPWITPSLFKEWEDTPNSPVVDEWTYCKTLGKHTCAERLKGHWSSWVKEEDIRTLAAMNINTLRIPIGYWALADSDSEPYVQGQVGYLKRVLRWATAYNLRVMLDLHGAPGSQNGFDNSGKRGDISWSKNANDIDRTLAALAGLASIAREFPIVSGIQAVNEPAHWGVPKTTIIDFYNRAYNTVRSIAPWVSVVFHDAFLPQEQWADLTPKNMTNVYLDTHIYHVFDEGQLASTPDQHVSAACAEGERMRKFNARTPTICGEFSLATTDCAMWLNGFQHGARWDGTYKTKSSIVPGGTCRGEENMDAWSSSKKAVIRRFAMAQLQAFEKSNGWIFWNFKTETADAWNFIKLYKAGIIPSVVGSSFSVCPK
ncbi:hypothetical protein GGI12_001489 [Dipsacomyces acuminosporus]|nr:hypothetical protein GGI12_001489 [Dipsacomyces acuminosporus]